MTGHVRNTDRRPLLEGNSESYSVMCVLHLKMRYMCSHSVVINLVYFMCSFCWTKCYRCLVIHLLCSRPRPHPVHNKHFITPGPVLGLIYLQGLCEMTCERQLLRCYNINNTLCKDHARVQVQILEQNCFTFIIQPQHEHTKHMFPLHCLESGWEA